MFVCINVYNNVQWQRGGVCGVGSIRRLVIAYRRKLGAENSTNKVASNVNNVKMMRHKRSTTIAANFQSRDISLSASSCFSCIEIITLN